MKTAFQGFAGVLLGNTNGLTIVKDEKELKEHGGQHSHCAEKDTKNLDVSTSCLNSPAK